MTDLPEVLPIFPLTGVLLLPDTRLPLNVFEPRYLALLEDALEGGSPIGMIQPLIPADDNRGPSLRGSEATPPELYRVGCAGSIQATQRVDTGRYLVLLKGLRRFRIERELPPRRGYRRVRADWSGFDHDGSETLDDGARIRLLQGLERFSELRGLELDFDALSELPGATLLHGVAAALPFVPAERQALLEAVDVEHRLRVLLDLMEMGGGPSVEVDASAPPN